MLTKLSVQTVSQLLSATLILTLLSVLLFNVYVYHAEIPFWDQWRFVEFLQKYYTDELSFKDFWVQHNEHRLLFPRMIFLSLALISHWTILYEKLLNIILAIGILAGFIVLSNRVMPNHSKWILPWLAVALASQIFSLRQFDNWVWGWQVAIFLSILCICWAIIALTSQPLKTKHVIIAAVLTLIASYSFINGLIFWVIGLLILYFINPLPEQRFNYLAIWIFGAVATFITYSYGYESPHHHSGLFPFWLKPLPVIEFTLSYLGSPFVGWSQLSAQQSVHIATIIGAVGIVLFTSNLVLAWRKRLEVKKLIPLVAAAFFQLVLLLFQRLVGSLLGVCNKR